MKSTLDIDRKRRIEYFSNGKQEAGIYVFITPQETWYVMGFNTNVSHGLQYLKSYDFVNLNDAKMLFNDFVEYYKEK